MRLKLSLAVVLLAAGAGCASAGAEFRPYQGSLPHPPMLTRAVSAERGDVPALARAGAIILGNITATGNGFAGADSVEEVAAVEAARRGGTHLVAEDAKLAKPRSYQPGSPVTLTFLVVRLADIVELQRLPERLQPRRGVHYVTTLTPERSDSEYVLPPEPLANAEQPQGPVQIVDGTHLKPLPQR